MPLIRRRPARRRAVIGYALLEALIAVVVTSIGFIGAARLQTLGASFSSGAGMRQRATLLVHQMTDRMRANHLGMSLSAYDKPTATSTACLTAITGCTPATLAGADMREWLDDVRAQLPAGEGIVCIDSTPDDGASAATHACDGAGRILAVKVWWTDKLGVSRFVTTARPTS